MTAAGAASVMLRTYAPQDHAAVIALWQTCGLHPSPSDSPEAIARMLRHTPGHRGRALGRQLMQEVEQRLRARGCAKVNLLIEKENAGVAAFYAGLGYTTDELVFMEKWIGAEL